MRVLLSIVVAMSTATVATAQVVGSFSTFGQGCPNQHLAPIYEVFNSGTFDLNGTSVTFVPSAGGFYNVLPGGAPLPFGAATSRDTFAGDDSIRGPLYLGFSFPFVGGAVPSIAVDIASNGYVYLDPGTITDTRCCNGASQLADFRNQTASIAAFGTDLDPSRTSGSGNIWFDTLPGVAYITWDNVAEDGSTGASSNTFQVQLYSDGSFSICWINCALLTDSGLVGFSNGGGAADPGGINFSTDLPLLLGGPFGDPLTINSFDTPTIGQTMNIGVSNVPTNTTAGALLLGASVFAVDLDIIGAESCDLLMSADIGAVPLTLASPTASVALPISNDPAASGITIQSQAAVIAPGITSLGVLTSNRGAIRIGDSPPDVTIAASGANNFNADTTSGFWRVTNGSPTLDIVSVKFDWVSSSVPNAQEFDPDQATMADRFDGGNSVATGCLGTYRNGSDVTTGLVYAITPAATCDANARTGWVGTNPGAGVGTFRTIEFRFNTFNPGDVFEVDIDTDGGATTGGAMAGMVVTIQMSDGSSRSGELVMTGVNDSSVVL